MHRLKKKSLIQPRTHEFSYFLKVLKSKTQNIRTLTVVRQNLRSHTEAIKLKNITTICSFPTLTLLHRLSHML